MPRLARDLAIALGWGCALGIAVAWPVLRSPTEVIFGREIVGRHHDAYTVIQQMATAGTSGVYAQPLTDRLGWVLAHVLHPVAAYNLVVLLTFPFTVVTTYALARYLFVPHAGAIVAGLAYAAAPLHLAHAAYHPHIAQTQWLPLYLLAVFALVDRPSWARVAGVAAGAAALVLSNDYGGLIGAVMTPIAVVAYWWASPRGPREGRRLAVALGALTLVGAAGIATIAIAVPGVVHASSGLAFPIADVAQYSARWWAYLVPPVDHPLFGAFASAIHAREGVTVALVEEQIFVSFGLLALSGVAAAIAFSRRRTDPAWRILIVLATMAVAAAVISIGPGARGCGARPWAPACVLHDALPMFRSYARFAFMTHLMIAIAGGCGAALLARRWRTGVAVLACVLVSFEYSPWPWRAHDVLPTTAHRWLAGQDDRQRTLDCMEPSDAEASVPWLMQRDLSPQNATIRTCNDPNLGTQLAAVGYTHVIIRRDPRAADPRGAPPGGLTPAARFADAIAYRVTAPVPPVVTTRARGFSGYESSGGNSWRSMESSGRWTVRSTGTAPHTVSLALVLESLQEARTLTLTLDGGRGTTIALTPAKTWYVVGPWTLTPGEHTLEFAATGPVVFWLEDWLEPGRPK